MELRDFCRTNGNSSFVRLHCAIIDTEAHMAGNRFIKHRITVRFGQEHMGPGSKYRVIFLGIRKDKEHAFPDVLKAPPNKTLLGHTDYPEYCALL